jgi:hypothetical protein
MTETKRNIFDIDAELDQIATAFDQLEEDPTVEDSIRENVMAYFGDVLSARDGKLDNYANMIAGLEGYAKIRKEEAARLAALARTDENKVKRLKEFLKLWLESKDQTRIETAFHKFWVQANGGATPIEMDEVDPEGVDIRYRKLTVSIDTEAVRRDLESGAEVPFARLGARGSHLRIK